MRAPHIIPRAMVAKIISQVMIPVQNLSKFMKRNEMTIEIPMQANMICQVAQTASTTFYAYVAFMEELTF